VDKPPTNPFADGYQAREAAMQATDNPHPPASQEHADWEAGFLARRSSCPPTPSRGC
jgi:hypothetical protein